VKKGQKEKYKYAKGVLKKGAKKILVASPHLLIFFFRRRRYHRFIRRFDDSPPSGFFAGVGIIASPAQVSSLRSPLR
jgi:hypothetical protein